MSIKERAHREGCRAAGGHYIGGFRGGVYEDYRRRYEEAATEQKRIDIENTVKWLSSRLLYVPEDDNPHVESSRIENLEEFLNDYIKAMNDEEEP